MSLITYGFGGAADLVITVPPNHPSGDLTEIIEEIKDTPPGLIGGFSGTADNPSQHTPPSPIGSFGN